MFVLSKQILPLNKQNRPSYTWPIKLNKAHERVKLEQVLFNLRKFHFVNILLASLSIKHGIIFFELFKTISTSR